MRHFLVLTCSVSLLIAGDKGIRPRASASDYPGHRSANGIELAAAVIPPEQVSKLFSTDLNKAGYTVVEVAVYPLPGSEANPAARDFQLRIGSETATMRPVSADTIAGLIYKQKIPKVPTNHDVTVYNTSTIGYESGGYDGVTGRRRSGVYTAEGVGVGVGQPPPQPPKPGSTPQDREVMRQELTDKALPEGRTTEAVAGYLYFPKPAKAAGAYHLTYYGDPSEIRLDLPAPKK